MSKNGGNFVKLIATIIIMWCQFFSFVYKQSTTLIISRFKALAVLHFVPPVSPSNKNNGFTMIVST